MAGRPAPGSSRRVGPRETARELRDYAAALSAFERYLAEGGKKDVQASIDELRHKVGRLKVEADVEGAEITIDDVALGVTPIAAPLVVNVGATSVMGGLAVSARGGLSDALATYPGDAKAIADAQSRTRAFAVTLAGAVATTVLFVAAPRAPERASVAVSPSGVVVRGVF